MKSTVVGNYLEKALHVAVKAALCGGNEIRCRTRFSGSYPIGDERVGEVTEYKGDIDVVTDADRAAEEAIGQILLDAYPDSSLLLEEGGLHKGAGVGAGGGVGKGGAGMRWIVDPMDGTTNFSHGFPVFSVSIALELEGRVVLGVVYDVSRGDLYHGIEGMGSWMGGNRLRVSQVPELGASLLATGFPYDRRVSLDNNIDRFSNLILKVQGVRRCGSAALDLAMVARGAIDGYWEAKLKPWDIAAGILLVKEAGGVVTDFFGDPPSLERGRLIASNGLIHHTMLDIISSIEKAAGRGPGGEPVVYG